MRIEDVTPSRATVPLIETNEVTKRFPGVLALDHVSFQLLPGQVHALVGENGAGKSTLMKVLGGIYAPDSGTVSIDGQAVTLNGPLDAQRRKVSIIHQELNLMGDLTVAQNIFFGREPHVGPRFNLSPRRLRAHTRDLLERVGLDLDPDARVGSLTVASQQMVEIAKALSFDARILIMDEPTAALTTREVEALFQVMADFISPSTGIIYISHRMEEITRLCDTITVMRDGRWVTTAPKEELPIPSIIEAMVGRPLPSREAASPSQIPIDEDEGSRREPLLAVSDLSSGTLVRGVSLEVKAGEILGLAGLVGAGRTEVARAIIGADARSSGTIRVRGTEVQIANPEEAVAHSIAYLSEDRKRFGLLLDKDITVNTALPSYRLWSRAGIIDDSRAESVAASMVDRLRIKTPSLGQRTRNLSGGNQQKVVVAKWLARDCDILIVDEPTRGIDVGAKDEIHALLEALAAQGKAIIVISSEIPELLRLAHRILVMHEGEVAGILPRAQATQEAIMALATGQGNGSGPADTQEATS